MSFFPFSSSSSTINTIAPLSDDPHLEVTVTPSSSAFYAGETFSVIITFRNTRIPNVTPVSSTFSHVHGHGHGYDEPTTPSTAPLTEMGTATSSFRGMPTLDPDPRATLRTDLPQRKRQIGNSIPSTPDVTPIPPHLSEIGQYPYPYSPGANPASRAGWPKDGEMIIRSPETWRRSYGDLGKGHERRTRSWALGNKGMTPQEMVWSLGGGGQAAAAPPLPTRRPGAAPIPTSHPHSRKISINTPILPPHDNSRPRSPIELPSIPESRSIHEAGTSRPSSRSTQSSSASGSRSRLNLNSDDSRTSSEASRRPPRSPLGHDHARTPSYQNAYGTSYPTPPTHPFLRSRQPTEPWGTTTVLWAYTRLIGQFHPSNQYIPPDPLLPLRSLMLHQPVGSGSLASTPTAESSGMKSSSSTSRWQMSFGTGAIGHKSQPSLTGSLFGLAKDLVTGGGGGTLEEERRRVWQAKDLPVLETARSLLGVDIKLKEGETKEFTYTFELPKTLPPAHRGRAYRFSYDLVLSLTVSLPGQGKRQKSKDIHIPIRVWANISLSKPVHSYDVLEPIIQTKDEATIEEPIIQTKDEATIESGNSQDKGRRRSSVDPSRSRAGDTIDSFRQYADHLLETVTTNGVEGSSPKSVPLSPSRVDGTLLSPRPQMIKNRKSSDSLRPPGLLDVNGGQRGKARQGNFVKGDDELLTDGAEEGGCGQAVEVLSRHSTKTSYDIAKEGEMVSVLTLVKTTYRLGETVLGVVTFNLPSTSRRVLKVSAFLESHELIPEALLPLSASSAGRTKQPNLSRLHAEFKASYTVNTSRLSFSLDIPSDSTPDFHITAGNEGFKGGLEWRLRIAFLVAIPRRKGSYEKDDPVHLLPLPDTVNDEDNTFLAASTGLSPLLPVREQGRHVAWEEMKVETVECEVPIKVLAGNTAFVVRPSVHVI